MRKSYALGSVGLTLAAILVGGFGVGFAEDGSRLPEPAVVPTVAPIEEPHQPDLVPYLDEQIEEIAELRGLSLADASKMLSIQDDLSERAMSWTSREGVLGFQFTEDGFGGELSVAPDFDAADLGVPPTVKVVENRIGGDEVAGAITLLAGVASTSLESGFASVTYEPFSDTFTVWTIGEVSDLQQSALDSVVPSNVVTEPVVASPAFGGRIATNTTRNFNCTTGFGILIRNQHGGYLLDAHCGTTADGQVVNGNNRIATVGRRFDVYIDRMAVSANGASWNVQIHQDGYLADMTATPGHVFNNGTYCHFGQRSNRQRCGTIFQVNVAYPQDHDFNGTTDSFTHGSRSNADCQRGDSGGPVWFSASPLQPRGQIGAVVLNSGSTTTGDCVYLSLDDQIGDVGNWQLL